MSVKHLLVMASFTLLLSPSSFARSHGGSSRSEKSSKDSSSEPRESRKNPVKEERGSSSSEIEKPSRSNRSNRGSSEPSTPVAKAPREIERPSREVSNPKPVKIPRETRETKAPVVVSEPAPKKPRNGGFFGGGSSRSENPRTPQPSQPPRNTSEHKDNKGYTERIRKPDGTNVTVSHRYTKSGKDSVTTYIQHPNGSSQIQRPNGTYSTRTQAVVQRDGQSYRVENRNVEYRSGRRVQNQREYRGDSIHIHRTTVYNNITIINNYNYRSYDYGRNRYYYYAPSYEYWNVYRPIIIDPWSRPYFYRWSYEVPWYRPYYTSYASSYEWLTDYFFLNLWDRSDYDRTYATEAQPEINSEIRRQVREQVQEAMRAYDLKQPVTIQSVVQPQSGAVTNPNYIFTVHQEISVLDNQGETCMLSDGDLIRLKAGQRVQGESALAVVVTAKADSCDAGSEVNLSLKDLQDMQNEFVERVETGANELAQQRK